MSPAESPGQTDPSRELDSGVLTLERTVLGITLGIVVGLTLFLATLWLVIKGGEQVGPHLELLNQFFPGYTVSVRGSFVGFVYGFGCGFVSGWFIATVYNGVVALRHR